MTASIKKSPRGKRNTINAEEVEKFDKIAAEWWDPRGKFSMLHKINPVRIEHIVHQIKRSFKTDHSHTPFKGLKLLDIGCGGGLISVPMHRLGAEVTAIDASKNNILTAKAHAKKHALDIDFRHAAVEDLAKKKEKYDIILALEVIEHVDDYKVFLEQLTKVASENAVIIVATINRNLKSLALAKVAAEYILRWIPAGTHDWNKFLKPEEIVTEMHKYGFRKHNAAGMNYNLLRCEWVIDRNTDINYLLTFKHMKS